MIQNGEAGSGVLTCGAVGWPTLRRLLTRFALELEQIGDGQNIPGSYWGAPEAGLIGNRVLARQDTPVHSLLHESCHAICMDPHRRRHLDTDAGGEDIEENGVCYLQIKLAHYLEGVGSQRLMADMDLWGYSFRLGSTRAWFEQDADDARSWLVLHGLLTPAGKPTWRCRQ